MFKRMLVLVTFFALLLLASAGATTGHAQGDEPLREDVTSLYRVADIYPGASGSNPAYLAAYAGALYFSANGNDGAGEELWKYVAGTGVSRRRGYQPRHQQLLPILPDRL